jgi:hypothetical protein
VERWKGPATCPTMLNLKDHKDKKKKQRIRKKLKIVAADQVQV